MNKLAFPLAFALSAAGCVYPAERGKMLEARVVQLETDKAALEASLLAQREQLEAQLPIIQEALSKLEAASRRSNADTGVQMEEMQILVATLRGQLEEQTYRMVRLEEALSQLRAQPPLATSPAVAASPESPEAASTSIPAPTTPPTSSVPSTVATATPVPAVVKPAEKPIDKADRQAFADAVVQKLKSQPAAGRKLADEFLGKWPKHALAARVYYEVGMSHLAEKNHRAALSEFGVFIQPDMPKAFTDSPWAPEALLRSADCFAALKMSREVTMALEEVVNGYPKSSAAKDAKARLEAQKKAKKK
ncbi:MAG: hypothetical protein LBM75_03510 [Myxococcales bacterium]|jgi:TolA-binding protein|nr:hypothetical protein [Myxococcales bacterium]